MSILCQYAFTKSLFSKHGFDALPPLKQCSKKLLDCKRGTSLSARQSQSDLDSVTAFAILAMFFKNPIVFKYNEKML